MKTPRILMIAFCEPTLLATVAGSRLRRRVAPASRVCAKNSIPLESDCGTTRTTKKNEGGKRAVPDGVAPGHVVGRLHSQHEMGVHHYRGGSRGRDPAGDRHDRGCGF